MRDKMIGIELVGTANVLRRITFQDGLDGGAGGDGPTSMQQWFLAYIWKHGTDGDVFQKDIEGAFRVRRSTATEILKAMERKGLIERVPSTEDKRSKKILLKERAITICEENQRKILRTEQKLIRGLSQEELQQFFDILRKIQSNIDDL